MILWISRHFGYKPSDSTDDTSPAEHWYNSLILTNARAQNVTNPYTDLDRLPFLHPPFLTCFDSQSCVQSLLSVCRLHRLTLY